MVSCDYLVIVSVLQGRVSLQDVSSQVFFAVFFVAFLLSPLVIFQFHDFTSVAVTNNRDPWFGMQHSLVKSIVGSQIHL